MSVGPNPTAVPTAHRCNVHKHNAQWLVTCPDCGETQNATNWYLAMGAARFHHWETALSPDNNIAREDIR